MPKPSRTAKVVRPQPDRQPWELPELDHERKAETISKLGEVVDRSGLPHIGPDGWSAASFFWVEVFEHKSDPVEIALYAFGATKEQLEDKATEFGRVMSRIMVALRIKQLRRVGRIKDTNYNAAARDEGVQDRKLFLQAHAAEYVPTQKTKVTIDDLRATIESASDADLHALAGTDPGTGEG